MLIYLLIIIVITQTYTSNIHHSHNRIVRRKTDYIVNVSMADDDIEMIDRELIQISNTSSKLSKTYRMKFNRTLQNRSLDGKYNAVLIPKVAIKENRSSTTKVYQNNSLIRSNYNNTKLTGKSNDTHIIETGINKTESAEISPRLAREISAERMWSIVQIWLIIYFVLAIPLWCTIGRCCCCLVCKCFKAQETIREAKLYAMWNPPGVLRKSTGDVIYTASEKEKEAYEELEHLIRTL